MSDRIRPKPTIRLTLLPNGSAAIEYSGMYENVVLPAQFSTGEWVKCQLKGHEWTGEITEQLLSLNESLSTRRESWWHIAYHVSMPKELRKALAPPQTFFGAMMGAGFQADWTFRETDLLRWNYRDPRPIVRFALPDLQAPYIPDLVREKS